MRNMSPPARRTPRGEKKYTFTLSSVAEMVDLTQRRVRDLANQGTFDPADLASVLAFVREHSPAEKTRIAKLLFASGCDPTKAAAALGITRSTLYRWAKG